MSKTRLHRGRDYQKRKKEEENKIKKKRFLFMFWHRTKKNTNGLIFTSKMKMEKKKKKKKRKPLGCFYRRFLFFLLLFYNSGSLKINKICSLFSLFFCHCVTFLFFLFCFICSMIICSPSVGGKEGKISKLCGDITQ